MDAAGIGPAGAAESPLKLETSLPYRLDVLASLVSEALSRVYAERYGIGVPESRVLVTLGEYKTMTAKAISAHSHMHKTRVSRAVALLERRKLVARRANRDKREALLSLTAAGRAMYDELVPIALDFTQRLVASLDAGNHRAFERAITALIERTTRLAAELGSKH